MGVCGFGCGGCLGVTLFGGVVDACVLYLFVLEILVFLWFGVAWFSQSCLAWVWFVWDYVGLCCFLWVYCLSVFLWFWIVLQFPVFGGLM